MTDDPLIQLRKQLLGAAGRRADARAGTPVSKRRRGRGHRRGLWLTLVALLIVAPTVAAATGIVGFGQSAETQGRKIARQAVTDTARLPACTPADGTSRPVLSDGAPLPAITAALPSLATAVSRDNQTRVLATLPRRGGTVLRRTIRSIRMPSGVRLTVFVQAGGGIGGLRDPAGCAQERRERAMQLSRDRSGDVKQWAKRRLAELRDTSPGLQTLWIIARAPGQRSSAGAGIPVRRGGRLRPGVLLGGSAGSGRSLYVALASSGASEIHLRAKRQRRVSAVPPRVKVRDGFWAVVLPRGTGPVGVRELSASGTVLRASTLRG